MTTDLSNLIGAPVGELDTPALLIDATILELNIETMQELCARYPVKLRPHSKSHKSREIARLQTAKGGAIGICCAKLGEAERFAAEGMDDILVTTPLVGKNKLARLAALLPLAHIKVVVDNASAIESLGLAAQSVGKPLGVIVEIDVGQHRCGVAPGPEAARLAQLINCEPFLRFGGLQGYQGKAQSIIPYRDRFDAVEAALSLLQESADHVRKAGFDIQTLTGGGTGSIAIDLALGGLTEVQPGSYIFMDASYDRIQWSDSTTICPFRPALSVLVSVVSRPNPERVIVDAGWKSLSSDSGPPIVKGRPDLEFEFAGDEHGMIRTRNGEFIDLHIGDSIEILPSHCDTTVNLYDRFIVIRGGLVQGCWNVAARGLTQ